MNATDNDPAVVRTTLRSVTTHDALALRSGKAWSTRKIHDITHEEDGRIALWARDDNNVIRAVLVAPPTNLVFVKRRRRG